MDRGARGAARRASSCTTRSRASRRCSSRRSAGLVAARTAPGRGRAASGRAAVGLAVARRRGWAGSRPRRSARCSSTDGTGGLGPALAANPGGWLAALAFVRGIAHARLPAGPEPHRDHARASRSRARARGDRRRDDRGALARPVPRDRPGPGARVPRGRRCWRSRSRASPHVGGAAPASTGVATRRWLALAGVLVRRRRPRSPRGSRSTVGHAIALALYALRGPAAACVGFVAGFDRRSVRILLVSLAVVGVLGTILRFFAPDGPGAAAAPRRSRPPSRQPAETRREPRDRRCRVRRDPGASSPSRSS